MRPSAYYFGHLLFQSASASFDLAIKMSSRLSGEWCDAIFASWGLARELPQLWAAGGRRSAVRWRRWTSEISLSTSDVRGLNDCKWLRGLSCWPQRTVEVSSADVGPTGVTIDTLLLLLLLLRWFEVTSFVHKFISVHSRTSSYWLAMATRWSSLLPRRCYERTSVGR